jgi:predicted SAM-dependent methyltransferase
MKIRTTPEGLAYLNIGCGASFFPEWTNIDNYKSQYVDCFDIRNPLPYPDNSFDAVYSSHVLEHLTPLEGKKLVSEIYRILKQNGICRIVVPDLERICTKYLKYLNDCLANPTKQNLQRYNWLKIELLDQMVREKPGGLMQELLKSGNFDMDFVKEQLGDQIYEVALPNPGSEVKQLNLLQKILSKSRKELFSILISRLKYGSDPRNTGEAHKWMYDKISLKILLEEQGLVNFSVNKFDESEIKYWEKYNLDKSVYGDMPRKPDSLYVECKKG